MKQLLRVIKFGGTSVGDASCIRKAVAIIRATAQEHSVVVVVSAMSGVTNRLIEAATRARAGDQAQVCTVLDQLRDRHRTVLHDLIDSPTERCRIWRKVEEYFQQGELLCREAIRLGELTPETYDAISSLGERVCAQLVAAVLAKECLTSEAIDAAEILVTDANHGSADPQMDLTRERCETRLRPLLRSGVIPVVTGFIGATAEGVLTTLGRGGSDYSATILAAALGADEVVIWTDVDGLHTADPRLVSGTRTVLEISYREAAELAHFGAKVLHPKTLRPVKQFGIPLWIRNTFAPKRGGTKITHEGPQSNGSVTAIAAIHEVGLITIGMPGVAESQDVLDRILGAPATVRGDVLLLGRTSLNGVCLVVHSSTASRTADGLSREFGTDHGGEHISLDSRVALITIVGPNVSGASEIADRVLTAFTRECVTVLASAQGCSECSISFVVPDSDAKTALVAAHHELQLGEWEPVASLAGLPQVAENSHRTLDGM